MTVGNYGATQPPGWYYAEGDPPGTQRYWDGAQWIGDPQTALGAASPPVSGQQGHYAAGQYGQNQYGQSQYPPGTVFAVGPGIPAGVLPRDAAKYRTDKATYGHRVGAWIIDAVVWWGPFVVGVILVGVSEALGAVVVLASLFTGIANSLVLQGLTSRSLGKRAMGTKLVRHETNGDPGFGLVLLRFGVPWAFSFFSCQIYWLLDFLWPLWDDGDERITDKILKVGVVRA